MGEGLKRAAATAAAAVTMLLVGTCWGSFISVQVASADALDLTAEQSSMIAGALRAAFVAPVQRREIAGPAVTCEVVVHVGRAADIESVEYGPGIWERAVADPGLHRLCDALIRAVLRRQTMEEVVGLTGRRRALIVRADFSDEP